MEPSATIVNAADPSAAPEEALSPGRRLLAPRSFDALKVLAALTAASGVLLHLVGSVFHDSYLAAWGLDAALFPKTVDVLIILGFKTVVGLSLKLFPAALSNVLTILGLVFAVTIYWSLLKVAARDSALPAWVEKVPRWLAVGVIRYLAVLSMTAFVILFVVLLGYLMAAPIAIAQTMARQQAAEEGVLFSKGCTDARQARCFDLKRGGEVLQGFLIDSSPDNIAFYDVAMRRSRVTSRSGSEVLGILLPMASSAASSASQPPAGR